MLNLTFFFIFFLQGGAATATLSPAKTSRAVYFPAGKAGFWKLPGKWGGEGGGVSKRGTTKRADTSNELQ